ncbi:glycosyltransferase family 4 protein [Thermococcus sp. JdF3]|uniref:glycosyltransferase family 4 protein n=1 Tax=Thermococcus sp. JdF3 TaxID=1638258 RepID=UPI001439ADD3|nr:glycosyltransferase family 4 protein [Thermococcus sp. JdF3]NJE00446.1 glycosyltransferase [Thermococcus sp. JdF3]
MWRVIAGMSEETETVILISPIRGDILNPKKGGEVYVRFIIDDFLKQGNKIIILTPSQQSDNNNKKVLCHIFPSFGGVGSLLLGLNFPYLFRLARVVKQAKRKLKLALNGPFGAISTYILSKILNAEMIYIAHNVEADRYSEKSVFEHEVTFLWVLSPFVTLFETFAVKADKIIAISKMDKKRFVERYIILPEKIKINQPRIIISNSQNVKREKNNKNMKIVFHGSYRYLPNKEAMSIIKEYIAREIKYQCEFVVFGSGSPKLRQDNFLSLGFVDNIHEFLSSCDIAIVPLKRGAGVKLKMLDYMCVGLPIVTTKKGAEGLDLVNGKHAIIVDDVNEEFIKAIEYLIENPKIRRRLGHNAKKLAKKKHTTSIVEMGNNEEGLMEIIDSNSPVY